jgi:hypothetical protein
MVGMVGLPAASPDGRGSDRPAIVSVRCYLATHGSGAAAL